MAQIKSFYYICQIKLAYQLDVHTYKGSVLFSYYKQRTGKMNTKFLSYLLKMHWTAMSRFLITFIWNLRSLMRGIGQFNENGLERWFTIVSYNLADYKLN